jgi:hypothetical protein
MGGDLTTEIVETVRRCLSASECGVVVSRHHEPRLVRGPGSVRTFWRWKRVVVIDLGTLTLETVEEDVRTSDDAPVTIELRIGTRVTDPLAAALKAADYRQATRQMVRVVSRVVVGDFLRDQLASEYQQIESAIRARATARRGSSEYRCRRSSAISSSLESGLYSAEELSSPDSMTSTMSAARWRTRKAAVSSETTTSSPAQTEVAGSRPPSELAVSIARPGRILSLNLRGIALESYAGHRPLLQP